MDKRSKEMKILFVISSLTSGGAERVLTRLANYWSQKGWDVTILSILPHDLDFYKLEDNIKIVSLGIKYKKNPIFNNLWYLYGIRKIIKEGNFDAVISFISMINILTLISTIGLKTPIIISERNNYHALSSTFLRFARRVVYPLCDTLVVLSQYDYDKYSFVKNKKVIFNPIDNFLDVKFEDKENLILAVGSLTHQKGYDRLLKALSLIDLTDWKVIIIGEGPLENEIKKMIKELNLTKYISLIGRRKDINNFYKRASIFVLSSHWEGFPNVLAEAMASGCACVSFNCITGPSNIIRDGENGFLVEQDNILMLSKGIRELMRDRDLRKKFFNKALEIREELDINKIAGMWEESIMSLIDKKR
jgi:GalNAc-alpha-(1->4)-GalNAc-alpha-(1->3)-diNAcBac-PP-undecaprenol alpha-1,4-N-acetyl-D-galactosaminyltransferase